MTDSVTCDKAWHYDAVRLLLLWVFIPFAALVSVYAAFAGRFVLCVWEFAMVAAMLVFQGFTLRKARSLRNAR